MCFDISCDILEQIHIILGVVSDLLGVVTADQTPIKDGTADQTPTQRITVDQTPEMVWTVKTPKGGWVAGTVVSEKWTTVRQRFQ